MQIDKERLSDSPKQAAIMLAKFREIKNLLETWPEIGTIYKNGLRKLKLGKFRYNLYYRVFGTQAVARNLMKIHFEYQ